MQTLAALTVGALASQGVLPAFGGLLGGDALRGSLMTALLAAGAATAIWGPFRIRGWRAALLGALAIALVLGLVHVLRVGLFGGAVPGALALAAGFTVGGVVSAAAAAARRERALVTGALTLGLMHGAGLYALPHNLLVGAGLIAAGQAVFFWAGVAPYLAVALAVPAAGLAVARVRRPARITLEAGPLLAVLLAALLAIVLLPRVSLGPLGGLLASVLLPVLAGLLAWWLAVPKAAAAADPPEPPRTAERR
ncbi:MAG: hypothetical protein GEU94_13560 [Micromonosporaceae bacterium]|nr:hypothetical protein [Micromonosporaceae bacterium]